MSAKNFPAVSVVIPTLGGPTLDRTIEQLNRGTVVPAEILICIPEAEASRAERLLRVPNVRIVRTAVRGQVAQRAVGFQRTESPCVLQVDDDIFLEESCLERLLECAAGRPNVAVSPSLVDHKTGLQSRFMRKPPGFSLLHSLMFRIVNGREGYQPGRISKAGVNMAFSDSASVPSEVDWLPGGCVLHSRPNLVLQAFYPFPGKAYSEDLFHSALLREKGVVLIHCPTAVARVDFSSSESLGLASFARIMYGFARAMLAFARRTGRSTLRFSLFLPVHVLLLVRHKLIGK